MKRLGSTGFCMNGCSSNRNKLHNCKKTAPNTYLGCKSEHCHDSSLKDQEYEHVLCKLVMKLGDTKQRCLWKTWLQEGSAQAGDLFLSRIVSKVRRIHIGLQAVGEVNKHVRFVVLPATHTTNCKTWRLEARKELMTKRLHVSKGGSILWCNDVYAGPCRLFKDGNHPLNYWKWLTRQQTLGPLTAHGIYYEGNFWCPSRLDRQSVRWTVSTYFITQGWVKQYSGRIKSKEEKRLCMNVQHPIQHKLRPYEYDRS